MVGDAMVAVQEVEAIAENPNSVNELRDGEASQENPLGIKDVELEHVGGPEIRIPLALDGRARLVPGHGYPDDFLGLDLPSIGDHPDRNKTSFIRRRPEMGLLTNRIVRTSSPSVVRIVSRRWLASKANKRSSASTARERIELNSPGPCPFRPRDATNVPSLVNFWMRALELSAM
jgi:hypothetical protein